MKKLMLLAVLMVPTMAFAGVDLVQEAGNDGIGENVSALYPQNSTNLQFVNGGTTLSKAADGSTVYTVQADVKGGASVDHFVMTYTAYSQSGQFMQLLTDHTKTKIHVLTLSKNGQPAPIANIYPTTVESGGMN